MRITFLDNLDNWKINSTSGDGSHSSVHYQSLFHFVQPNILMSIHSKKPWLHSSSISSIHIFTPLSSLSSPLSCSVTLIISPLSGHYLPLFQINILITGLLNHGKSMYLSSILSSLHFFPSIKPPKTPSTPADCSADTYVQLHTFPHCCVSYQRTSRQTSSICWFKKRQIECVFHDLMRGRGGGLIEERRMMEGTAGSG